MKLHILLLFTYWVVNVPGWFQIVMINRSVSFESILAADISVLSAYSSTFFRVLIKKPPFGGW